MLDYILKLISGTLPFCLTLIIGGYFTFKTDFFQIRNFIESFKILNSNKKNGVSGFKAMCNSLAAAVGTGNIVGVAAAITYGGAGAIFWMWISSFLGMVIKSSEIAMGVYYRDKKCNNYIGGPHIYIQKALPKSFRFLGLFFAFVGLLATVFGGNMAQVNSAGCFIVKAVWYRVLFGGLISVTVLFVIWGGAEKITAFLSKMLPFMALLYIFLCCGVIIKNYNALPNVFKNILVGAFSPRAVTGGVVCGMFSAISVGASKGIFSNEAGVGTAPIIHSLVETAKPHRQSFYGIFEVFADTTVLCSLTALTILSSGVIIEYGSVSSFNLTLKAFMTSYGQGATYILCGMLVAFGVSSVIGWATYGISFSEFLFGAKGKKAFVIIYPFFCALGLILSTEFIWQAAEFFNGILVIINLLVLLYMRRTVLRLLKGELE